MKYNLNEALDRLKVPREYRSKIYIINKPKKATQFLNKAGFQPRAQYIGATDSTIIFVDGNKAEADYLLAHEIFGHRMAGKFPRIVHGNRFESYAVEKGLEKILELGSEDPEYLNFFDKQIRIAEQYLSRDYRTWNPIALLMKIYATFLYYENLEIERLKKLREEMV